MTPHIIIIIIIIIIISIAVNILSKVHVVRREVQGALLDEVDEALQDDVGISCWMVEKSYRLRNLE